MKGKLSITIIIFFSAFMLNVSAMAYQQRYDRREEDENFDPFVIEMTDQHVFKYLKNTWFFDVPGKLGETKINKKFYLDESGFGNEYIVIAKTFLSCHLKFLMIDYVGFFEKNTASIFYWNPGRNLSG